MNLIGFRLFLVRRGLKKETINTNIRTIKRLNSELDGLTLNKVNQYIVDYLDCGKASNSLNAYISALKQYGDFDKNYSYLKQIKYFKTKNSNVSILSVSELKEFLSLENPYGKKSGMWDMYQLFFKVLAYTGARPNEIATLTKDMVDFGRGVFTLSTSKTNSPRNIPIPEPCLKAVKQQYSSSKHYLFSNKYNNPINDRNWSFHFRNRLKILRINRKGLTCYSLRHSFITHMLEEDVNVFKVKKIVGHKSFQTTEKYTHLTTKDIVAAAKQHPLVKKARTPKQKLEAWLVVTKELMGDDFYINEEELIKGLKQKTTS